MTGQVDFPPVIGVSGASGSGKTLLIEGLVRRLAESGLRIAVVKHCTHRIEADRPGKDTDRIFTAGADVLAAGREEAFARFHEPDMPLADAVAKVAGGSDLCLVEGYRGNGLPRIVVGAAAEAAEDSGAGVLIKVTDVRAQAGEVEAAVRRFLQETHAALPVMAAVLVGGASTRMGRPKALLDSRGRSLVERMVEAAKPCVERVVLAGSLAVPERLLVLDVLPDAPDAQGPLAGILSCLRWRPAARWVVLSCDLPLAETPAVRWLLSQSRVGVDAVFAAPNEAAVPNPLFAVYEPTARTRLEKAAASGVFGPRHALAGARVVTAVAPPEFKDALTNVNTPAEWEAVCERWEHDNG